MAIRTIEYTVDITGISPATEQFAGTKGDHRVTKLNICVCDALYDEIVGNTVDGKAMYRFDVYDGEGGIWSSEASEFTDQNLSIELEERHTRFGGKITVYLVITALSTDNETEMELYSFPARLRLNDKPEGTGKVSDNYESITTLVEVAKAKADEAADTVDLAVARLEETAKTTFGKSAYQVAVENGFEGNESDWLASLKGDKGDKGDAFTYDDLTDEQKAQLKEGIEQCVADRDYDPTSDNAQSGKAVAEAVELKMPKVINKQAPYCTVPVVNPNPDVVEDEDGNLYPSDDSYGFKEIDEGTIPKEGVSEMANFIPTRDSRGNLWTGEPVDDEDCVNKEYANQHFVPKVTNTEYSPSVYSQDTNNNVSAIYTDRTDGYMEAQSENGALPDGDLSEFGGFIARRKQNGNLLSGTPKTNHDVANKMYVDAKTVADQTYNPESENAQSGKAVAEAIDNAIANAVSDWELIEEITLTEDVTSVEFSASLDGYKSFSLFFVSSFTEANSATLAVRVDGGAMYFMWKNFTFRSTEPLAFWHIIEEIGRINDVPLYKSIYPKTLIRPVDERANMPFVQGLADSNADVSCDTTFHPFGVLHRYNILFPSGNNAFKAGSKFYLCGRK